MFASPALCVCVWGGVGGGGGCCPIRPSKGGSMDRGSEEEREAVKVLK